ncbi:hypothetical protein ACFWCB_31385 [Streptomyces sp. NPDC060048]|uniref:hypothetical protein n=1 Tax=unclassified Streptomyces TaxID=2593676 RepID=UPI00369F85E7
MSALLRLYPAAYRREFGDEIADAYHEATDGAGRPARIREAADVAGHALRMRLGVGSARRAGRFLAALAPFAVLAVGANAMYSSRVTLGALYFGYPVLDTGSEASTAAAGLATVLVAALALTGRRAGSAWSVLAGTAALFAAQADRLSLDVAVFLIGPVLLLALVAVLSPPDLRPAPRLRTATGTSAVLAGAAALTVVSAVWPLPDRLDGLYTAVPVAGGLVLAGRQAFARLRTAPAVFLAGLLFVALGRLTGALGELPLPHVLGLLLAVSIAVGIRRRRGPAPSV